MQKFLCTETSRSFITRHRVYTAIGHMHYSLGVGGEAFVVSHLSRRANRRFLAFSGVMIIRLCTFAWGILGATLM